MGMFDYVACNYPLPDGLDASGLEFQTKDTPAQGLETYVLREDGTLWTRPSEGDAEPVPIHGDIEFYASNWAGSCGKIYMTSDDSAPWRAEYVARFTDGRLTSITGGKTAVAGVIHVPRADFSRAAEEYRNAGKTTREITARNLATEWVQWFSAPGARHGDHFKAAEPPALEVRMSYLYGQGAWGLFDRTDEDNLRDFSAWLEKQPGLPENAAGLLNRTRLFLRENAESDPKGIA